MGKYYKIPEEELLRLVECQYKLGGLVANIDWTTYHKSVERTRQKLQEEQYPNLTEKDFVNWNQLMRNYIEGCYEKI